MVTTGVIFSTGIVLVCAGLGCCEPIPSVSDNMIRPTRPKVFTSPEELRSYLEQLGNFYAIAGRPRFGKRTLGPRRASYDQDEPMDYKPAQVPLSVTDLLQILSSVAQNQK